MSPKFDDRAEKESLSSCDSIFEMSKQTVAYSPARALFGSFPSAAPMLLHLCHRHRIQFLPEFIGLSESERDKSCWDIYVLRRIGKQVMWIIYPVEGFEICRHCERGRSGSRWLANFASGRLSISSEPPANFISPILFEHFGDQWIDIPIELRFRQDLIKSRSRYHWLSSIEERKHNAHRHRNLFGSRQKGGAMDSPAFSGCDAEARERVGGRESGRGKRVASDNKSAHRSQINLLWQLTEHQHTNQSGR